MNRQDLIENLRKLTATHVASWKHRIDKAETKVRQNVARKGMMNSAEYGNQLLNAWREELLQRISEIVDLAKNTIAQSGRIDPSDAGQAFAVVARECTAMPPTLWRDALMSRGLPQMSHGDRDPQSVVADEVSAEIARQTTVVEADAAGHKRQTDRDEVSLHSAIATKDTAQATRDGVAMQWSVGKLVAIATVVAAVVSFLAGVAWESWKSSHAAPAPATDSAQNH